MILNKQKRIGEIIIFAEGETPEFEIIKTLFHDYLGYSIVQSKRSDSRIITYQGYDIFSKVILINTPTSNINSLANETQFYDYIFGNYALKFDLDTKNNPVYFIFDRDPKNNKQGVVQKLLAKLNNSQNDTDEQNGLLLLSYPSIESFILSLYEQDAYEKKFQLGNSIKDYVYKKNYKVKINDENIDLAVKNFANALLKFSVIDNIPEILGKLDVIGLKLFDSQRQVYSKENLFFAISQFIEILIDLQIITL